jgi:hypothetical protein
MYNSEFGRLFCFAKNRAFRSNSSEAPMRFLRDFRYNPWRAQGLSNAALAIKISSKT